MYIFGVTLYPYQRRRQAPVCDFCGDKVETENYLSVIGCVMCWDCVMENKKRTEDWEPDSDE